MLLHYFWYNLYIKCYNFENILLSLQRIYNMHMKQIEYVTIKNASNKVLKKMRQIGEEKAQRLQKIQDRWDKGAWQGTGTWQQSPNASEKIVFFRGVWCFHYISVIFRLFCLEVFRIFVYLQTDELVSPSLTLRMR